MHVHATLRVLPCFERALAEVIAVGPKSSNMEALEDCYEDKTQILK